MPRYRSRAPRPRKLSRGKRSKAGSLPIYVFFFLACVIVIWWIIKPFTPPGSADMYVEDTDKDSRTSQTPKKTSGRSKTDPDIQQTSPQEEGLDHAIQTAAVKLGIPERSIRRSAKGNDVNYRLPLDPNTVDLTFANMIFKGEVEKQQGKLISGEERNRRQYLKFSDQEKTTTYNLELFFDDSIYQNKVADKVIAIVVDDFGNISGDLLRQFHQIDIEVCFAIFPEEPNSVQTMQTAVNMGRECLIHVPMEPLGYPRVNPGKNAVFVHLKEHEIRRLMKRFISQMHLCKGINNHMGSFATTDETTMQAVMSVLKEHDLYLLDSRTSNVSVAHTVAQRMRVDSFRNDVFLDAPDLSSKSMEAKLAQCIQMASNRQYIVAITHCHTEKHLEYLQEFIRRLKKEGFVIVPVSRLSAFKLPPIS
ncbi:MAG: divergent polysaccharide deacetylase family protein [Candidatus Cloacimonetes bacterium]|nr:divergent polysaccharide deacetylase family protein [Candidatus Cloacimonadota bacterium]